MSRTTDEIQRLVDEALLSEEHKKRNYLGTSTIGMDCGRALWYSYKHSKPVDSAKVKRIFSVGHKLESLMIDWLKMAGMTLFTEKPNGEQYGFVDGIVSGHCDGIALGVPFAEKTPHLLEFKTANDFRWKNFVKEGFCSDEKYKAQIHIYMHKLKLSRCLAMVLNKNTQEIYYEIIELDEFYAISMINRGKEIVSMEHPPERKYPSRSFFKCQYCNYKKECWDADL